MTEFDTYLPLVYYACKLTGFVLEGQMQNEGLVIYQAKCFYKLKNFIIKIIKIKFNLENICKY